MSDLDDLAKRLQELEDENRRRMAAQNASQRSSELILGGIGDMLDLKQAISGRHTRRVTAYTIAVARAVGISTDQIAIIAQGAFLHDIGKMAIPNEILRKRAALTPEEVTIMREHCYHAFQMLQKIPFLAEASEIVYSHQEYWDGTGYPRGLKGEQIPRCETLGIGQHVGRH